MLQANFPGGADVSAGKVVASQVSAWLASYPAGPATYNSNLEFIRAAFVLAVHDKLVADSPVAHIKTMETHQTHLQDPHHRRLPGHCGGDPRASVQRRRPGKQRLLEFLSLAGLGQTEASSLVWDDIDLAGERITTFRHKTSRGFIVPIYPQLRPLLAKIREERGGSPAGTERVFRIKEAKKAIAGACKRLGLPAYSHPAFRRMFITRSIQLGVDVKVIAEWQGQKDGGKLILDTYSHVAPKHSTRMAKLMAEEVQG